MPQPSRRARARIVATVAAFIAALALVPALPAAAAPKPFSIAVTGVLDQLTQLTAPAKGQPFDISFTVVDDAGAPAPLKKATTFTVSAPADGPGLTGTTTLTLAKGATGGTISGSVFSSFGNGVVLTVAGDSLTPDSITVNVLAQAVRAHLTVNSDDSVTASNDGCTEATPELPVCLSTLLLPDGVIDDNVPILSTGACDEFVQCLSSDSARSQLLVEAQNGFWATRDAPATMVIRCDKTLCGSGGVPSYQLTVDVGGGFRQAPICPSKGVLGDTGSCYDTVQSTRDGSGDLIAYVLFAGDVRASFK